MLCKLSAWYEPLLLLPLHWRSPFFMGEIIECKLWNTTYFYYDAMYLYYIYSTSIYLSIHAIFYLQYNTNIYAGCWWLRWEMPDCCPPLDTQLAPAARARAGAAVLGGEHGREVELVVTVLLQTHIVTSDTCY